MIIFVTPNRLLKSHFFEKKGYFSGENFFRPICLVLSSRTDVSEQFISVHNEFWQLLESYKITSLGPTRSMEKNSQKKDIFPMKNNFGQFFLVLPSMADLRRNFIRLHKL